MSQKFLDVLLKKKDFRHLKNLNFQFLILFIVLKN